jgi:hypothetical protein
MEKLIDPYFLSIVILPLLAFLGVAASVTLLLVGVGVTADSSAIRRQILESRTGTVVIGTICLVILVLGLSNTNQTWGIFLALVPPLLITHHAVLLGLYASRMLTSGSVGTSGNKSADARAYNTINSYFSNRTLLLRFGLPVIMLSIAGVLVFRSLSGPAHMLNEVYANTAIRHGAQYGAIGAYCYVTLELSRRTFRRDITSAFALWCVVSILIGPVLAGVVALLWTHTGADPDSWQRTVVFFFAGFAPKRVISSLEQATRQLLAQDHQPVSVASRMVPLSQLRGIVPLAEERLAEEGIHDVHSLAQAEPVRLLRNTSYDFRQILAWVDEALLITNFPRSWEALESCGIFGAVDLVSYAAPQLPGSSANSPDILQLLAEESKIEGPLFRAAVARLSKDTQVLHVNALYSYTGRTPGTIDNEDPSWLQSDPQS